MSLRHYQAWSTFRLTLRGLFTVMGGPDRRIPLLLPKRMELSDNGLGGCAVARLAV